MEDVFGKVFLLSVFGGIPLYAMILILLSEKNKKKNQQELETTTHWEKVRVEARVKLKEAEEQIQRIQAARPEAAGKNFHFKQEEQS